MDVGLNAPLVLLALSSLLFSSPAFAATPSNAAVPPFQWLEITSSLSGSGPPGLSYASMGYDPDSGTLFIFGGESNGVPQQQTFLLDAGSLSWTSPNPAVQTDIKPPARSMAITGQDFAASNRHGQVIIGGKGTDGPLDDAWEYDYQNQFWTEITISAGGPSARYSASGGRDQGSQAVSDPVVSGPNNTFYLAGGFDGTNAVSLSDVWKFEVAGVLSANNVDQVVGSWTQTDTKADLPSRVRQGSTVMPSAFVTSAGGCSSDESGSSCAEQSAFTVNVNETVENTFDGCPAPRVGPVLVPNFNGASTSFQQQALLLLGLFDNSTWNDGGGLNEGEIGVLDINNGQWSRVIPSKDPTNGVPAPREGAVAFSSSSLLFGSNSTSGSDIVIFGGLDANGNYLNDMWILRSYSASLDQSNQTWSGFGDGELSSGVDADGSGVTIQYITSCATQLSSSSSSSGAPGPTSSSSSPSSNTGSTNPFDTSLSHKVLSPVSLIAFMAAILVHSHATFAFAQSSQAASFRKSIALGAAGTIFAAAYGLGIAGLATSFTTISSTSDLSKRSSESGSFLKTSHGKAALAFVVVLYGILPLLLILSLSRRRKMPTIQEPTDAAPSNGRLRRDSNDTGFTALMTPVREKTMQHRATVSNPDIPLKDVASSPSAMRRTRARVLSLFTVGPKIIPLPERPSVDSEPTHDSLNSSGPKHSFEVLNRGNRQRRLSGSVLNAYSSEGGHSTQGHTQMPRSLSDLNWLDRRQNVAAFSEIDYALMHTNNSHAVSPVETSQNTHALYSIPTQHSRFPSPCYLLFSVILHAAILGLCVVTLIELFRRASKVFFILYLIWTVAFYVIIYFLIRRAPPSRASPLIPFVGLRKSSEDTRNQQNQPIPNSPTPSRPLSANELYTFPGGDSRGPYLHQPLFRRALSPPTMGARAPSSDDGRSADDYEDDDTQQRRIEQEIERRDVSIVTVPKRKLFLTNPS